MNDDSLWKLDDDPAVRSDELAQATESQRSSSVYPPGLRDDGNWWRIGTLKLWKSAAFKTRSESDAPFPPFDRGSLRYALYPDHRFEAEPFTMQGGRPAIAILLRSDKDPRGTFGTFSLDENDAHRIIELLNREMDATRAMAMERFRANGGDPASVASRRAPSRAERWAILDALLGDPDDDGDKGR